MGSAAEEARQTTVFIAGGGLVRLAMSLLLDRFGIDCVVVEKSPTTTDHQSRAAAGFEPWRSSGSGGSKPQFATAACRTTPTCSCSSTASRDMEFGRTRPEPNVGHTPAWKSLVAQDAVEEEILRVVERSKHATVLFSTECGSFEETNSGVRVRTRSGGDRPDLPNGTRPT